MIRAPRADELPDIAALVARQQTASATRDAMFDERPDAIAVQIEAWETSWVATSLVAERDGRLIGFVGAELDDSLNRVWIHGPLVEATDWESVADALLVSLEADVAEVAGKDAEIAADVANERTAELAAKHGFVAGKVHHLLVLDASEIARLPRRTLVAIAPGLEDAFVGLHDELFPGTYYTGPQLLEQAAKGDAVVRGLTNDGDLAGYAAGRVDEAGDGYLDFVGVTPSARRRGLGGALVGGIAHALSDRHPITALRLTVSSENTAALALYDALGFELQSSAVGYRRTAEL